MFKTFILILLFFCVSLFFAQDTIYFDQDYQKVENLKLAESYTIDKSYDKNGAKMVSRAYDKNGQITEETFFSDKKMTKMEGKSRYWSNGNLKWEIGYKKGKKDGLLKSYWENGNLKRRDVFINEKFITGTCFDDEGNEVPYYHFRIPPEFPGGNAALKKFMTENFNFPDDYKESGSKKIVVHFVIEKNGSVTLEKMPEGISLELGLEAIRVIALMPKWNPGMIDGSPVRVQYTIPIVVR